MASATLGPLKPLVHFSSAARFVQSWELGSAAAATTLRLLLWEHGVCFHVFRPLISFNMICWIQNVSLPFLLLNLAFSVLFF